MTSSLNPSLHSFFMFALMLMSSSPRASRTDYLQVFNDAYFYTFQYFSYSCPDFDHPFFSDYVSKLPEDSSDLKNSSGIREFV